MVEPVNAAAEPSRLETLVRNLKEMRRSLDAGSMTGPPATFGLEHPEATVRLWGRPVPERRQRNGAAGDHRHRQDGQAVALHPPRSDRRDRGGRRQASLGR